MVKRRGLIAMCAIIVTIILCMLFCFNTGWLNDTESVEDTQNIKESYTITRAFISKDFLDYASHENGTIVLISENFEMDCGESEKYEKVVELLKAENMPISDGGGVNLATTIKDNIDFNNIYVKDNIVYVDVKGENLVGSAMEEILFISQIVETLTNSFENIKGVQFLVDGQEADSLMGNVDISNKFTDGLL